MGNREDHRRQGHHHLTQLINLGPPERGPPGSGPGQPIRGPEHHRGAGRGSASDSAICSERATTDLCPTTRGDPGSLWASLACRVGGTELRGAGSVDLRQSACPTTRRRCLLQLQQCVAETGLHADSLRDNHIAVPNTQRRAVQPSLTVDQPLPHSADAETPARPTNHLAVCSHGIRGGSSSSRSEPAHNTHNGRPACTPLGQPPAQNAVRAEPQIWLVRCRGPTSRCLPRKRPGRALRQHAVRGRSGATPERRALTCKRTLAYVRGWCQQSCTRR